MQFTAGAQAFLSYTDVHLWAFGLTLSTSLPVYSDHSEKKIHIFKSFCLKISENKPFCVNEANKSMLELMKKYLKDFAKTCLVKVP